MRNWNPENLMYTNTDEYKYLDKLDRVIIEAYSIADILELVKNYERFNIQCGTEKNMVNLSMIWIKLDELKKIINDL